MDRDGVMECNTTLFPALSARKGGILKFKMWTSTVYHRFGLIIQQKICDFYLQSIFHWQ